MEVEFKRPELTVEQYEQLHGGPLYKTRPDQCCAERKIRVLHEAVRGKHAWASGIRRDQSPDRAKAAIVSWDRKFSLVKVSPLANWTKKDVWKMIVDHDIPYNPLHDQGYTSVGCWPCTRAVMFGEDDARGAGVVLPRRSAGCTRWTRTNERFRPNRIRLPRLAGTGPALRVLPAGSDSRDRRRARHPAAIPRADPAAVKSRRASHQHARAAGGYRLLRDPAELSLGEVMSVIEGPPPGANGARPIRRPCPASSKKHGTAPRPSNANCSIPHVSPT